VQQRADTARSGTGTETATPRRRRVLRFIPLAGLLILATTACDPSCGEPHAITPQGERMRHLWIGSCIAASVVGAFVLFLILYAAIVYRKRDDVLPKQIALNLPIEILYTVVPFVIIGALFFYTAVDEVYVTKTTAAPAQHGVDVVDVEAFQWGWTFRYVSDSAKVGVPTEQAIFTTGSSNTVEPTLVVPVDTPIQFQLHSNNVIHDFYVPELLFKLDVIPGRTNKFEVSEIERTGTFEGHCAELCGYDHARMNFDMKVVSQADYQTYLQTMASQGRTEPIPQWVLDATPRGSIAGDPNTGGDTNTSNTDTETSGSA
jgi:cytochrome c oxidase subunit 2